MTRAKPNGDPFGKLNFAAAPEPVKSQRKSTPPEIPDSVQPLIKAIQDTPTGVDLSIAGWEQDLVHRLRRILRGNRETLFPNNRLYIVEAGTAEEPVLRIKLGRLGLHAKKSS